MALFEEKEVKTRKQELEGSPEDAPKNEKLLVVDADTLVYAVASVYEYPEELLPQWNYDEESWERLTSDENYDEVTNCIYYINLEKAMEAIQDKIDHLLWKTGCRAFELHFTSGKNFRYEVNPMYKANRDDTRYPVGLRELKALCVEKYTEPDEEYAHIHSEIEADDWVVYMKNKHKENVILCAVDKDVLKGCAGLHFNYYESIRYNIPMKWVETTEEDAIRFPYIQCMEGDTADGIDGIKGIGPKKALKILEGFTTEEEYYGAVKEQYMKAGKTIEDLTVTMRLVSMTQLNEHGKLCLWEAPDEDR